MKLFILHCFLILRKFTRIHSLSLYFCVISFITSVVNNGVLHIGLMSLITYYVQDLTPVKPTTYLWRYELENLISCKLHNQIEQRNYKWFSLLGVSCYSIYRCLPTLINYVAKSAKDIKFNSVDLVQCE